MLHMLYMAVLRMLYMVMWCCTCCTWSVVLSCCTWMVPGWLSMVSMSVSAVVHGVGASVVLPRCRCSSKVLWC